MPDRALGARVTTKPELKKKKNASCVGIFILVRRKTDTIGINTYKRRKKKT